MINPIIGDIADFQLVKSGIYGDKRKEVSIVGVVDYSAARLIDPQLQNKHIALFPYFKDKVENINDPSFYRYLICTGISGTPEVIGLPWVMDSTYKPIKGRVRTIVISNWREEFDAPVTTLLANLGAVYTTSDKDK